MSVTVVLGDDHPLVRQGVRRLLEGREFEILGEGSDGLEVILHSFPTRRSSDLDRKSVV